MTWAKIVKVNSGFLGIHTVSVYVTDLDQSLHFYVNILGFGVAFDAQIQSGERWVAVSPPDGTTVLTLIAPHPDSVEFQLIGRPTGVVLVTQEVAVKFQEWRKRGVQFLFTPRLRRVRYQRSVAAEDTQQQKQPVWGGVFTQFKDIDGNIFSLAGFDEVNREIEAQRQRLAARLEAERRAAQELEIAKQVQARLFPQRLPPMETLEIAGACIQARQVGGDYHDVLDLGRGRFGIVIADISGKGMPAALLMANLQANLRSQSATAWDEPARMLCSVNQLFHENTNASSYATLFFADYDDKTAELRYANCGHLAALLVRGDRTIEWLGSTTTVVGLFKEWECSIAKTRLHPGDTLVLYTDGITEAFSPSGDEFGEDRLVQAIEKHRALPVQAVISTIVDEVQQFSSHQQHDDITLIVARCTGRETNASP